MFGGRSDSLIRRDACECLASSLSRVGRHDLAVVRRILAAGRPNATPDAVVAISEALGAHPRRESVVSGNRIFFLAVSGILVLFVVATVILAPGSPEGPELLASLVQTLVTIGVLLLVIRLIRDALRRR